MITKIDSIRSFLNMHQPEYFQVTEDTTEFITLTIGPAARSRFDAKDLRQRARDFCKLFNWAYKGAALSECCDTGARIVIAVCPHITNHPANV